MLHKNLKKHILYKNKKHKKRVLNKNAFTLIELMIVIAIIGIISAFAMTSFMIAKQRADDSKRMQDMASMKTAIELYASKHGGSYPTFMVADASFDASKNLADKYVDKSDQKNQSFKNISNEKENMSTFSYVLSYITKIVNASTDHTEAACVNFDALGGALLSDGDISVVPKDPQDAPSVTCYKAWSNSDFVAGYAYTWQKYENITEGYSDPANKKVGFIVGRESEITRSVEKQICQLTRDACTNDPSCAFPVMNPRSATTLCAGPTTDDGFVADILLGISNGQETDLSSGDSGGGGSTGTCSDPQYNDDYAGCVAHGVCDGVNPVNTEYECSLLDFGYCNTYSSGDGCNGSGGGDPDSCAAAGCGWISMKPDWHPNNWEPTI